MKYWRKPLDYDQVKVPRGTVVIIKERCKGCAFCVEFCPKDVLKMSEEYNEKGYHPPFVAKDGECVNCELCEMLCPEFAIYSLTIDEEGGVERVKVTAQQDEMSSVQKESGSADESVEKDIEFKVAIGKVGGR